MKKITVILLLTFLCGILLVSGCQKAAKKPNVNNNNQVQQTTDSERRVMASRFSTLATEVDGVQKATTVVSASDSTITGNTGKMVVMIGLTLNSKVNQDQAKENSIKEQVKTKIMESDNRISEVLVTTNPDMIKKLQDVAEGVIQGKPVQSYTQDIDELNKSIRGQ